MGARLIKNIKRFEKGGAAGVMLSFLFSILNFPAYAEIEEVVVTAQKREQNIQDVSVSITAFGTTAMRDLGISRPRDLARFTPGLVMNATANGETDPIFTLRGVGMNDVQSNQNPAVTPYMNEIALASHVMVGGQIFDLERIEVLKGPQGTLYGRNTTGGAMRFISNKPTREFDAFARVDYAEYDRFEFEGAVGGPLTETLAGRLAVTSVTQQDGWQTLDLGGQGQFGPGVDADNGAVDRQAFRASLLFTPSDDLDILVVSDYSSEDSEALGFAHAGNLFADGSPGFCSFTTQGVVNENECASFGQIRDVPGGTPITPGTEIYQDNDGDPRTIGSNFGQGNDIDGTAWGLSASINWSVDRFVLTSVTGYRRFDRRLAQDQGASPFDIHDIDNYEDIESITQELRVSSDESWGPLKWQLGVYYSNDDQTSKNSTSFRDHTSFNSKFFQGFAQKTESFAIFSQVEWEFNEQWRLIGGLRYTEEEREFTYQSTRVGISPASVPFYTDKIDASEVSAKIGVDYQYSDDIMFYANFNRGFKAGGFPASIAFNPNQFLPFEPETLHAYEIGFKSTLQDGKLRFNAALYYYDWRDFQAQTAVDRGGIRLIVLGNAGDAEILGVESEVSWMPTDELSFSLGFNWMDADIVNGIYDGDTPAHTPEFMFNGIARYDSSASILGFKPFVQLDFSYQDDIQFILANHPGATEDAYALLNARIGIKSEDGRWELAAYGRNLTDKLYRTEVFGPGSGFLPGRIHYGAPQIFGVSLNYSH